MLKMTTVTMFLTGIVISLLLQAEAINKVIQDEYHKGYHPLSNKQPSPTKSTTNTLCASPGQGMDIPSLAPSLPTPPVHVKKPFLCQWQS